jgi:hypothetical protein
VGQPVWGVLVWDSDPYTKELLRARPIQLRALLWLLYETRRWKCCKGTFNAHWCSSILPRFGRMHTHHREKALLSESHCNSVYTSTASEESREGRESDREKYHRPELDLKPKGSNARAGRHTYHCQSSHATAALLFRISHPR